MLRLYFIIILKRLDLVYSVLNLTLYTYILVRH